VCVSINIFLYNWVIIKIYLLCRHIFYIYIGNYKNSITFTWPYVNVCGKVSAIVYHSTWATFTLMKLFMIKKKLWWIFCVVLEVFKTLIVQLWKSTKPCVLWWLAYSPRKHCWAKVVLLLQSSMHTCFALHLPCCSSWLLKM
jgi:hypothetical protein